MRRTERQLAMLREMGIHLWQPAGTPGQEAREAPLASRQVLRLPVAGRSTTQPTELATGGDTERPLPIAAPGASEPNIHAMSWPQLREAVAGCTACRLCQGRTQTVFGTGHIQARWMVVGEAPGEQEDLQGEPFVGKSGQLLDAMLRAIRMTRSDAPPDHQVFIANTIKCRPPGNRNPLPDELAKCEPFLIRQIGLLQPRIILAMGRFAVQSLLRSDEPVGRLRGRVHHYQGVPLIVTYHPAYLLRNQEDKARAWDDLCLAVDTAAST